MNPRHTRAAREKGLTILEALFAISALLVGIVSIFSMAQKTIQGRAFARHASIASSLARDKMEQLRAAPYTSLASSAEPTPIDANGRSGGPQALYLRTWTVTAGPTANTKKVSVAVSWGDGETRMIHLTTIIVG